MHCTITFTTCNNYNKSNQCFILQVSIQEEEEELFGEYTHKMMTMIKPSDNHDNDAKPNNINRVDEVNERLASKWDYVHSVYYTRTCARAQAIATKQACMQASSVATAASNS